MFVSGYYLNDPTTVLHYHTGQTIFFFFFFLETDGLGVTSTSNSPLTIQRGHFMKKTW